ncbi:NAD(P)-dependent oxidoreductase [Treponema zioleckii]|uniref:NAD(P)-dependent oxidoreductase n=1 Tax=Treponema zioleckii TaxID=331680 RepID=UPI00168AD817|nr:NAD(P)-dependent oxidoreductase [Treponema zioleckii]
MKIGFIGLGIMGQGMCANIVKKHDDTVYCYDHHQENIRPLVEQGAVACESGEEIAKKADVIISMVPKSENSLELYSAIIPYLNAQKLCIDMSTIDPSISVDISRAVQKTGALFLDAPVVKSKMAAIAGTLGIYVGGTDDAYKKALPILQYMGENIIHLGKNGAGLVMKACHNALVSQIQNGVNETIALAKANGIDVQTFAKAVSYGGGQNSYLDNKKNAIANKDFETAFSVQNMAKDVNLALKLANESGLSLPGEENVAKVYEKAIKLGLSKKDFSATAIVVTGELTENPNES